MLHEMKRNCLGTEYNPDNPQCVVCDDRKECKILKERWEKKIIDHFEKSVGVHKASPLASIYHPIKISRKTGNSSHTEKAVKKVETEEDKRARLIAEITRCERK